MAGGKSDYLENKVLDHVLGGATFTQPASVYISLHTGTLNDDATGTEVSGGSYSRQEVDNDNVTWAAASGGSKTTLISIPFGAASANWGTVTWAGVWDAVTGGNLLYRGPLAVARNVLALDTFTIPIGGIVVTED